jgi:translation initiation factor RLI1
MGHGSKWVNVDFAQCKPHICDPETGTCRAAVACTHNILLQEDLYEEPMVVSMKMCVGCADCVRACPLSALAIERGI